MPVNRGHVSLITYFAHSFTGGQVYVCILQNSMLKSDLKRVGCMPVDTREETYLLGHQ
jgi:hypothetical protein